MTLSRLNHVALMEHHQDHHNTISHSIVSKFYMQISVPDSRLNNYEGRISLRLSAQNLIRGKVRQIPPSEKLTFGIKNEKRETYIRLFVCVRNGVVQSELKIVRSVFSADNFRPYLTSFQGNSFTDYINAVFVDVSSGFV